jgi:uncharacterized protein (TIGR03437 family)
VRESHISRPGTAFDRPNVMRFLKKFVVTAFALVIMSLYLLSDRAGVKVSAKVFGGPPLGFTGAPDEGTCIGCHYTYIVPNPPNSGGSVVVTGLPATYNPGQTYTLTITVAHPTARRWGFETTALVANGSSNGIGTLTILDTIRTIKRDANNRTYVSHYATESSSPSEDGTAPGKAGSNSWSFTWTAPPASSGNVTFYAVGNAANNQVSPEDDYIYTTSAVSKAPNAPPVIAALPDRVLAAGDTIAFYVSATDPEGSAVTLSASTLTNSIFDPGSKRFTFVASADEVGSREVVFSASDGTQLSQKVVHFEITNEGTTTLEKLTKVSGPSNYLDSSHATAIDLTAVGSYGAGAKVVFNGLELATQSIQDGLAAQIPASEMIDARAYAVRVKLGNGELTSARALVLASSINSQAVTTVDAASFQGRVAPGQIVAVFGGNLVVGNDGASAATIPLPKSLQGASVFVDGIRAPLFYAGPSQINYQLPYGTAIGNAEVVILRDDGVASYGHVVVASSAVACFSVSSTGEGQASAINSNYLPNSTSNKAMKGDYVSLFSTGTGKGLLNESTGQPYTMKDGDANPVNPLVVTAETPVVTIGGKTALIYYSGLAPGYVGLWQLNIQIPPDAPSGVAIELVVTYGGRTSNRVTIAVE